MADDTWVYKRGVWSEPDFALWNAEGEELDDMLTRQGFSKLPTQVYGDPDELGPAGICIYRPGYVVAAPECKHFALAEVAVGGRLCWVILPDLPSYWMFLREAKDIAQLLEYQAAYTARTEDD